MAYSFEGVSFLGLSIDLFLFCYKAANLVLVGIVDEIAVILVR